MIFFLLKIAACTTKKNVNRGSYLQTNGGGEGGGSGGRCLIKILRLRKNERFSSSIIGHQKD